MNIPNTRPNPSLSDVPEPEVVAASNPCTVAPFNEEDHAVRVVSSLARQALEVLNGFRPLSALLSLIHI